MARKLQPSTFDFFFHNMTMTNLVRALCCDPDNTFIVEAMKDYCKRAGLLEHLKFLEDQSTIDKLVNRIKKDQKEIAGEVDAKRTTEDMAASGLQ